MKLLEIARLTSMVAVAWAFLCAAPACAYLDPGTGSFIFQILAASFLGAMATIKIWWSKVAFLFKGKGKPKPKLEPKPEPKPEPVAAAEESEESPLKG
jgi:hypothetical protein